MPLEAGPREEGAFGSEHGPCISAKLPSAGGRRREIFEGLVWEKQLDWVAYTQDKDITDMRPLRQGGAMSDADKGSQCQSDYVASCLLLFPFLSIVSGRFKTPVGGERSGGNHVPFWHQCVKLQA